MKILTFSLLLATTVLSLVSFSARADIATVSHVDVNEYLGDWYQISHIPLWFEGSSDCACARQRLTTTSNAGIIGVVNTCTKDDGSIYTISGTASDDDPETNAKFTVSFQGVAFKGTYWIIGLDSQYRYAVVSDKGGDALYILSRTPTLSESLYQEAIEIASKQVSTSKLKLTNQTDCAYPQ